MFTERKHQPLDQFESALQKKGKKEVSLLLTTSLLQVVDEKKQNVMHLAARYADESTFKLVVDFVVKNKMQHLLNQPDNLGLTPLHVAASFNNDKVIEKLLDALGNEAENATKTVTNQNQLPIHLAFKNPNGDTFVRNNIFKLLSKHLKKHGFSEFGKPISEKEVLAQYKTECKENPELEKNLKLIVGLVNAERKTYQYSETHPFAKKPLKDSIKSMRFRQVPVVVGIQNKTKTKLKELEDKDLTSVTEMQVISILKEEMTAIDNSNWAVFSAAQAANCGDLASSLVRNSNIQRPEWYVEKYQMVKGKEDPTFDATADHAFNVYFRDLSFPLLDPKNQMSIVADVFTGFVCLTRDLPKKLKADCAFGDTNVFVCLNPNYHMLEPIGGNHPELEVLKKMTEDQRKKYLNVANQDEGRNPFHYVICKQPLIVIKFYFKFLREFKDTAYTQDLLMARDIANSTPLQLAVETNDPKIIIFVFGEYRDHFKEKLADALFGENGNDAKLFRSICNNENITAMEELIKTFQHQPAVMKIIQTQAESLLKSKLDDPGHIDVIGFLANFPDLISKKLWKESFEKPIEEVRPVHRSVWAACKKIFSPDEQNALIENHPNYKMLVEEYQKLKKIKNAMMQPVLESGMFKMDAKELELRNDILSSIPDQLVLDSNLELNINKGQIENWKKLLAESTSGEVKSALEIGSSDISLPKSQISGIHRK